MTLTPMAIPGPSASPIELNAFGIAVTDNVNELIVDLTPILSTWTTYTPTWGSTLIAPAIVDGSISGRYVALGKYGLFTMTMTLGASSTLGTGTYTWTLPPGWTSATNPAGNVVIGKARVTQAAGGVSYLGCAKVDSAATVFSVVTHGAATDVSPTLPIALAVGDQVVVEARLEIA